MASNKNTWHDMSDEQLENELGVLKNDLQKMELEHTVRGTTDNSQFKKTRGNIARIFTELRKRELAEYSAEDLEMRSRIRARRARLKKA
jgi:large subunit ribosomal protein L29